MTKVVLIGDSIRMGYQPFVQKKLAGEMEVWGPSGNCRHSLWALDHFGEWIEAQEPDIIHFNFGIHDQSENTHGDGQPQILPEQYALCLRRFITKAQRLAKKPALIWATTTPLYQPTPGTPMKDWAKRGLIDEYNAIAIEIVKGEGIRVDDLHGVVMANNFWECLRDDGCHMVEHGNDVLSDTVIAALRAVSIPY